MAGQRTRMLVVLVAAAVPIAGGASAANAGADKCFGKTPTKGVTVEVDNSDPLNPVTIFTGTPGDDVIIGTDGDDQIDGGGGNDRLCALGGVDDVAGGTGNDRIDGGDDDDLLAGDIALEAGDISEPAGNDHIHGGRGNDLLTGDHDTDDGSITADGGNDVLIDVNSAYFTREIPDFPFRGRSADPNILEGDVLIGDHAPGEVGDVHGRGGNDRLVDRGGDGDLLVGDHFANEGGNIFGDGGNDNLYDAAGVEDDLVGDSISRFGDVGTPGDQLGGRVEGEGGNDVVRKFNGLAQNLTGDHFVDHSAVGQGGDDRLSGPLLGTRFVIGDHYSSGSPGLVGPADVDADSGAGGSDTIRLGPANDGIGSTPPGTPQRNIIAGDNFVRAADGVAVGGAGDNISTGAGDEARILGGPGADRIDAGAGNDGCNGGPGQDVFRGCDFFAELVVL